MLKIKRRDTSEILPGQYALVDGVWGCIERVNRIQCVVRLTNGNVVAIKKRDVGDTYRRDLSGTQVSAHDEKVCNRMSVDALDIDVRCKQRLAVYAHAEGQLRSAGQVTVTGQRVVCASTPPSPNPSSTAFDEAAGASVEIHPRGVDISTDGYVRVDGLLSLNYDLFIPEGSYIFTKHGKKEMRSIRMNGETGITVSELHVADLRRVREDTTTSIDSAGVRTNELYLTGVAMPLTEHLAHLQATIERLSARVASLEGTSKTPHTSAAKAAAATAASTGIAACRHAARSAAVAATHAATALALLMLTTGNDHLLTTTPDQLM